MPLALYLFLIVGEAFKSKLWATIVSRKNHGYSPSFQIDNLVKSSCDMQMIFLLSLDVIDKTTMAWEIPIVVGVQEGEMSKLLGTPFGLSLEILDIHNFSCNKIKKKFTFLCSCSKLSLVDRATIVNQVLLSSRWFFVLVWRGFKIIIRRIRGLLENYLWSDIKHVVCKKVF